eukprot:1157900-Amphidinium_carterae.2
MGYVPNDGMTTWHGMPPRPKLWNGNLGQAATNGLVSMCGMSFLQGAALDKRALVSKGGSSYEGACLLC